MHNYDPIMVRMTEHNYKLTFFIVVNMMNAFPWGFRGFWNLDRIRILVSQRAAGRRTEETNIFDQLNTQLHRYTHVQPSFITNMDKRTYIDKMQSVKGIEFIFSVHNLITFVWICLVNGRCIQ